MPQTFSEAILQPNAAESAYISSENFTFFTNPPKTIYLIENISIIFPATAASLKSSGFFTIYHEL
jgi:hypothetical protein